MAIKSNLTLIALVLLAVFAANAHAAVPAKLSSFLSTYVTSSTINNATFTNATFNGDSYIIMQFSSNYLVIQNASGTYSLVTNATTIDSVITPQLSTGHYPNATTLQMLNSSMQIAERYGYANFTDCLQETGLVNNQTCTLANDCFACKTVPVCSKVLNSVGGPDSTFGLGIMNFSANAIILNQSYAEYYRLLANINSTNAGNTISALLTLTNNITRILNFINQNALFPPPATETYADCNGGLSPNQQPWYCSAVGFCSTIPVNSTALLNIRNELSTLQSGIPSATSIDAIAVNSSKLASSYAAAALTTKNGAAFTALIANYTSKINVIANSSNKLLLRYNNATLNASVATLQTEFTKIKNAGVNQSINTSSNTLKAYLTNTTRTYQNANATYNQVYILAQNNTAALLADQLSYQQIPAQLASLAQQQATINAKLNGRINSNGISTILPQLQTIKLDAALFGAPLTPGYIIKAIDAPFISAILGPSMTPSATKIASAPAYAALESLIVGILILAIIFVIVYITIIKKGKFKDKSVQRSWMIIFIVIIVLIIIYSYSTYVYAANATAFIPFNYFLNSVKSSGTVYIALNGAAATNASIAPCVTTLQTNFIKEQKVVQIVKLENYSCVSGSNISVLGIDCYDNLLAANKPVILISQSQSSSIIHKGLYGTVLYSNGTVNVGPSCALSTLFSNSK